MTTEQDIAATQKDIAVIKNDISWIKTEITNIKEIRQLGRGYIFAIVGAVIISVSGIIVGIMR